MSRRSTLAVSLFGAQMHSQCSCICARCQAQLDGSAAGDRRPTGEPIYVATPVLEPATDPSRPQGSLLLRYWAVRSC